MGISTATTGVNFTPDSASRIAASTRDYERTRGITLPSVKPSGVASTPTFYARLTDFSGGGYNWVKQDFIDGDFQDTDPQVADTDNNSAYPLNDSAGQTGNIVELRFYGYDDDDDPAYVFAPAGETFVVKLTKDGGSSSAYTYKLTTFGGTELAHAVPLYGHRVIPGAQANPGTIGIAFKTGNPAGDFGAGSGAGSAPASAGDDAPQPWRLAWADESYGYEQQCEDAGTPDDSSGE